MSSELLAWARGPYELIEHAEVHFNGRTDSDRRIALVGFDNAIEVAIATYLQLNPKLRGGKTFPKEKVQKWLTSYHSKIEFFEEFVDEQRITIQSSITEIIWYHALRNELYHSGNGMVPERHCLKGVRFAAIEVFKILYGIGIEPFLENSKTFKMEYPKQEDSTVTKQTLFLELYINFEQTLRSLAPNFRVKADGRARTLLNLWNIFKSQYEGDFTEIEQTIQKAIFVRNNIVHGNISTLKDKDLIELIDKLDLLSRFIRNYGFSYDMLSVLKAKYGDWVRPDIKNLRIVHKDGLAWLEVTSSSEDYFEEQIKTKRMRLDFIADVDEANDLMEPTFSIETSAQEKASRFFNALDLGSILYLGMDDLLFTDKGIIEAMEVNEKSQNKPRL